MNNQQLYKVVECVRPQAIVNNASYTTYVIDTAGFRKLDVIVHLGATDIALSALKIQEADAKSSATALTSGADVTGLVFGTSTGISGSASTLPSATDDNNFFKFEIDLRGRKRYLQLVATVGNGSTGAFISAIGVLGSPEIAPDTATELGAAQVLRA